jgi:hypothetical protein
MQRRTVLSFVNGTHGVASSRAKPHVSMVDVNGLWSFLSTQRADAMSPMRDPHATGRSAYLVAKMVFVTTMANVSVLQDLSDCHVTLLSVCYHVARMVFAVHLVNVGAVLVGQGSNARSRFAASHAQQARNV